MPAGTDDDHTLLSTDVPGSDEPRSSLGARESALTEVTPESQRLSPPASSKQPSIFAETARFAARGWIAEGGMGTVIRAFDKDLEREVAIKVLGRGSEAVGADLERFDEEARITGQLEHPFIVPVYEYGTDQQGARFLCMKLVQGRTLEETLNEAGASRLTPALLADHLQIYVKVCDAVAFAHSRGVMHRDLKPSNVMSGKFGEVYVMDWGLARVRGRPVDGSSERSGTAKLPSELPGALIGTPSYMAPEQLLGLHDSLDERTDIFMLGAILHEILTGAPPRTLEEVRAILAGRGALEIRPVDQTLGGAEAPAELSRIASKAMARHPADRYASVNELRSDIERFQRGAWHLPSQSFTAGQTIVAEGDAGETAYIIVDGRCSVFRNETEGEVHLREMGPGDVFGETAVFSSKPRTAGVRALTDVVVLEVTTEVLSNALGLSFWMGSFVRALANRFREIDERLRHYEQEERIRDAAFSKLG